MPGPRLTLKEREIISRGLVAEKFYREIVRHVLQYGGAAEGVDPAEIRKPVTEAARRVLAHSPAEVG